jgi:periplasmic divalent cation tolerance protein
VSNVVVVLMTAPSLAVADELANALVQAHVAACVSILPGIRSVYRWQGRLERGDEVQLLVKTTRDRIDATRAIVAAVHPFEVPELIVLPVVDGLPAYLSWVVAETRPVELP